MGTYEYNKNRYKILTLRLTRDQDADIIEHLDQVESVNAYICDLMRQDIRRNPQEVTANRYEVIEELGTRHDVLKGFETFSDAVSYLYMYVSSFQPAGRVYIAQRFTGIMSDGKKIKCGKILDIKVEQEEIENA